MPWKKIKSQELHVCLSQGLSLKRKGAFLSSKELVAIGGGASGKGLTQLNQNLYILYQSETKDGIAAVHMERSNIQRRDQEAIPQMIPDSVPNWRILIPHYHLP